MVQEASSKRNSFSANWDAGSTLTQETQDDAVWAKENGELNFRFNPVQFFIFIVCV